MLLIVLCLLCVVCSSLLLGVMGCWRRCWWCLVVAVCSLVNVCCVLFVFLFSLCVRCFVFVCALIDACCCCLLFVADCLAVVVVC